MSQDTATTARAKTLALFSDGTGNSSAKLFKTNVWRMYQAVNLGPSGKGEPLQVAYYDNGIGTHSIKALAVLAGIFGIGLKPNVLRLYRFACRNGTENCQFFCFGFSRGAFTIRLVAAMLAEYGLVKYSSEAELNARTLDTFRAFMRSNNPNVLAFVGRFGRWVRDGAVALRRRLFAPELCKCEPEYVPARVRFIGVWDTVAAYGGPIAEITRGIDDYLWPLTMTDSCLNGKIETARHALSIDDERDAFQPVLWDEVDWHRKAVAAHPGDEPRQQAFRDRLKQVWFAGMHSDVGGGYPDESLSYVSLVWMMHEAEQAGLRLLPEQKKTVTDLSNSLGPIHDSRGGLGVYYRPQPRKIAAFLHPRCGMDFERETLSLRDPVLGELPKPPHGVLMGCRVHESVLARLLEGTDDYSPATLPPQISVEPYSAGLISGGSGNRFVPPALVDHLTRRDDDWYARQERIWDFVLWRRLAYFAAVAATLALVAMPMWAEAYAFPEDQDHRAIMQRLTSWSRYVPVEWLNPWIGAFGANSPAFLGLLGAAVMLSVAGGTLQAKARTLSSKLWRQRIARQPLTLALPGVVTRIRNGAVYQRLMQVIKWRILPALAAAALFLALIWLFFALLTQVAWSIQEPSICEGGEAKPATFVRATFSTREPCLYLGAVERGHRYEIAFIVVDRWRDGPVPADPVGVRRALWRNRPDEDPGWTARAWQWLGAPYRRVIDGNYLQPAVKLRSYDAQDGMLARTATRLLEPVANDGVYRALFDAPADGDLYLFANDAAFLFDYATYYANNRGTAEVSMSDLDARAIAGTMAKSAGEAGADDSAQTKD